MKTISLIVIVFIFTSGNLASEDNKLRNATTTPRIDTGSWEVQKITESSFIQPQMEKIVNLTLVTALNNNDFKDIEDPVASIPNAKTQATETTAPSNEPEMVQIVLKDLQHLENNQKEIEAAKNSTRYLIKTNPLNTLQTSQNSNFVEKSELIHIVLKDLGQLTISHNETGESSASAEEELTTKPLSTLESFRNSNSLETFPKDVINLTDHTEENEYVTEKYNKTSSIVSEFNTTQTQSPKPMDLEVSYLNSSFIESRELVQGEANSTTNYLFSVVASQNLPLPATVTKIQETNLTTTKPKQEVDAEGCTTVEEELLTSNTLSLNTQDPNLTQNNMRHQTISDEEPTRNTILQEPESTIIITTTELELSTTKPLMCLEEYAVKQMNFILDHMLMELQEFVAKVLQATVNSVFSRDHLKLYAEGLNSILNPDTGSDYSDEDITKDNKPLTQDEIYEDIVNKLNFLKSKPSKYLQRHLPPDWINEYRNKRSEMAIWLDKATEQMHREFNSYITEEQDYIKYKYFNETFDDISRATEIHHKLALLADLVKIVKNKKQITFMDLYMQD